MTEKEIIARLTKIFHELFDDESIVVTRTLTAAEVDDWDSLEHINLISSVERAFGIRFKTKEVSGMKNVGEMIDIIAERA